jgi:hypothetical protein
VPVPDKSDLQAFLRIDDWTETRRSDHYRYRKQLSNGDILRTKVSFGRGPAFNDPGLWHHVWKDQLKCSSEDDFWNTLKARVPLQRGQAIPPTAPTGPAKPTWLYEFLVNVVQMESQDVLALSQQDAMDIYLQRVQAQPDAD